MKRSTIIAAGILSSLSLALAVAAHASPGGGMQHGAGGMAERMASMHGSGGKHGAAANPGSGGQGHGAHAQQGAAAGHGGCPMMSAQQGAQEGHKH